MDAKQPIEVIYPDAKDTIYHSCPECDELFDNGKEIAHCFCGGGHWSNTSDGWTWKPKQG